MNKRSTLIHYIGESPPPEHELTLWYRYPATDWEKEALPIGNSFIGGMVFGDVALDHIQYNEKTLWAGGPNGSREYHGGNVAHAAEHLQSVRDLLWAGDIEGAAREARNLVGNPEGFGAYQPFGDLYLDFRPEGNINILHYRRELDLSEGLIRVSYFQDEVFYTREYFCSYPDKVLVIRLTASRPGKLCLDVIAECLHEKSMVTAEFDTLVTRGEVKDNGMVFESRIKVINEGGEIKGIGNKIAVNKADSITIVLAAGTNYENCYPCYRGQDPCDKVIKRLNSACSKSYEELKKSHISDYQGLFNRVFIDFDEENPKIPTDKLLLEYSEKEHKWLEVLMFQYGRYLLIASSREGSLPANLQGIWNHSFSPPWCCDYHFNINIQMNYWPAGPANLNECALPLVEYVDSLRTPGRITALHHFGVKDGGWVVNTMNNPFGYTAPGWDFYWGWAPNSNAFICQNLWDYYEFTNDAEYLRNKIYPIMKEAAQFWASWLIEDRDGTYVSTPSYSPEHGDICIGAAMDQQLAYELFTNVIEASRILGVDEEFREKLLGIRDRLSPPVQIGRWGQIQEWKEDLDSETDTHRHISQLVALYPGKLINKHTPKWLEAAKVTMIHRGDESTGWSRVNKLNLWARALDGNHAYRLLQGLLKTCVYPNLFDTHPPFQIDGNFGYVSGVCEMLIQSHLGYIELLPALPDAWPKGKVKGLLARGAFEISMEWENKKITSVLLKSIKGNRCRLKNEIFALKKRFKIIKESDNTAIFYKAEGDSLEFNTEVGESYRVIFSASYEMIEFDHE